MNLNYTVDGVQVYSHPGGNKFVVSVEYVGQGELLAALKRADLWCEDTVYVADGVWVLPTELPEVLHRLHNGSHSAFMLGEAAS